MFLAKCGKKKKKRMYKRARKKRVVDHGLNLDHLALKKSEKEKKKIKPPSVKISVHLHQQLEAFVEEVEVFYSQAQFFLKKYIKHAVFAVQKATTTVFIYRYIYILLILYILIYIIYI